MSQCFKGLLLILHVPWEGRAPLEDPSQGQSSSNISAGIWDSPGASIIFLFWLCVNEEFEHKIYSLITPLYLCRLLGETQSLGDIVKQTGKLKKEFGKWSMFAFLWETELCVQIRKGKTPWDARKGVYWSMYPTCMIWGPVVYKALHRAWTLPWKLLELMEVKMLPHKKFRVQDTSWAEAKCWLRDKSQGRKWSPGCWDGRGCTLTGLKGWVQTSCEERHEESGPGWRSSSTRERWPEIAERVLWLELKRDHKQ